MQIARTAPILVLIALSGCTEKPEASDPPAIGLTAEPGIGVAADEAPMAEQTGDIEEPVEAAEAPSEPPMRSPALYD